LPRREAVVSSRRAGGWRAGRAAAVAAAVVALVAAGCSSSSPAGGGSSAGGGSPAGAAASGSPIAVASLASLTGAASFAGWQLGAKAYFDYLNKHGGINGHPVDFTILDDAGSPTQVALLARREVDAGVVAFAGSISLGDCAVNGKYYDQQGIVSIDVGSDPTCFDNPNIDPVNSGPATDPELQMVFAAEDLHDTRICMISDAVPGEDPQFQAAVTGFEQVTGQKILKWIKDWPINASYAPAVAQLKSAGCQAVALPFEASGAVPLLADAQSDGIHDITWISGLALYEQSFLSAAKASANGMYLGLEFAPPGAPGTAQMMAAFQADNIAPSEPEESSYTAAYVLGTVLKTIKGPITRASVLAAFRAMKPLTVPTMGTPFTFGTATAHHPNQAAYIVKIANGAFADYKAGESWLTIPGS
jgi:branched-chain amino acid transport system substrate-binding protein